jgi:hypothetical protein
VTGNLLVVPLYVMAVWYLNQTVFDLIESKYKSEERRGLDEDMD